MPVVGKDTVTIGHADGVARQHARAGGNTVLGIHVQSQGANVTPTTMTATAKRGDVSVSLTVDTSTTGYAFVTLTTGNLTTLEAGILDTVFVYWQGTYVSGGDTYPLELEMPVVVSDRAVRFALSYQDLEALLPAMARACSYPGSQTNWWPQIQIALRRTRNRINRQQGGVKDYLLRCPDELRELAEYASLMVVTQVMGLQEMGQNARLTELVKTYAAEYEQLWADIAATVSTDSDEFGTPNAGRALLNLQPMHIAHGYGTQGGGGPL